MSDLDAGALFSVNGLVAVITGGGTGIGLMLAQALEANGAIVYILGRRQEVLEKAAATAKHGNIHSIKADVTSKSDLAAAAEHVSQKSGYVNLVIGNAGITGPTLAGISKDASLLELRDHLQNWELEDINNVFAVNTTAVLSTLIAFLELLDKGNKAGNVQQKSQFVAIASAGAVSRTTLSGYPYNVSKAATLHMMKMLASRLVDFDIRANTLGPGLFPSEMTAGVLKNNSGGVFPKEFIPEGRAGDIKDMAGAILFLASRAGAYVNGNMLLMDGGRISILPATY